MPKLTVKRLALANRAIMRPSPALLYFNYYPPPATAAFFSFAPVNF